MEATKTLSPPANWQDFESLCKKLWGEIWQCPEIQKNGRLGQEQTGVDIFGTPFNNSEHYYGIQCKGKNEYSHSQFTEVEILREIKNAERFSPPLKKYYLATTAQNDSKIQQFVREQNLAHKAKGLFEIHLFAWETIVDLIYENKQTSDYYLKSQNYKTNQNVVVTLHNEQTELIANPRFKRKDIIYRRSGGDNLLGYRDVTLAMISEKALLFSQIMSHSQLSDTKINLSYFFTKIRITNTGSEPIEEYKIFLEFDGEIEDLSDTNEIRSINLLSPNKYYNTRLWKEFNAGRIVPAKNILVGDDTLISDDIYIKPKAIEQNITIKWKLISKNFKDNGELIIKVIPDIEVTRKLLTIDDEKENRIEEGLIEDYMEVKSN